MMEPEWLDALDPAASVSDGLSSQLAAMRLDGPHIKSVRRHAGTLSFHHCGDHDLGTWEAAASNESLLLQARLR